MKTHGHAAVRSRLEDPGLGLQIRIQGVDGSVATFAQSDPDLISRTLDELDPLRVLANAKITIAGNHSVTTFIPPLITRIDLITDRLSVWDFPFVIGALLELTEAEFNDFHQDRRRRAQFCSSGDFPLFLDIEMVSGQRSFLWMEVVAGLPVERLLRIYSLLKERSLIFGLGSGGIGVLNLANMVRFSVHPDLGAKLTDGKAPLFASRRTGGQASPHPRWSQNENKSKMERNHQ